MLFFVCKICCSSLWLSSPPDQCCKVCYSSVQLYGSGGYKPAILLKFAFLQGSCS